MTAERRDVLKSKEAIKQAYIKLCMEQETGTSKITVSKILETANISRGTFYAHFQDIYDVRDQIEDDLLAVYKRLMEKTDIYEIAKDPYPHVQKTVAFFFSHANTIRQISGGAGSSFIRKYKQTLLEGIQESRHTIPDLETAYTLDACIVGALVDGCLQLVFQGQENNPQKTAQTISTFLCRGLGGFYNRGR